MSLLGTRSVGLGLRNSALLGSLRPSAGAQVALRCMSSPPTSGSPPPVAAAGAGRQSLASSATAKASEIVSAGMSRTSGWMKRATVPEPQFQIVNPGSGAVLHAHIPRGSHIVSLTNCAICFSPNVHTRITFQGSPVAASVRALSGGDFLMQHYSVGKSASPVERGSLIADDDDDIEVSDATESGDVVLAPKFAGDLAILKLSTEPASNGAHNEYYIARDSFVASTPGVNLSASMTMRRFENGHFRLKSTGDGSLALASHGRIFRVQLGPDEVYNANIKHVVAWSTSLTLTPVLADLMEDGTEEEAIGAGSGPIRSAPALKEKGIGRGKYFDRVRRNIRKRILGEKDFYSIRGPGDVYLTSRLPPTLLNLDAFKRTSAPTAAQATTLSTPTIVDNPQAVPVTQRR
ncbi:hypothetical protein H696_03863 [Fonticula alba]|uniref:Uncharacterized protein n=1 Tax=Fonticula alba TaxID=691883 RepID=A0A058Z593_FONAL|nr:hypothetical protein H696_03863 [Fonticula alba]KCV69434.1 hypothetical protein H696_03863 [Fonticula alba]|eukprot:XP_009495999.1 hypothetical protein H696_03863 [Fonticula alba]